MKTKTKRSKSKSKSNYKINSTWNHNKSVFVYILSHNRIDNTAPSIFETTLRQSHKHIIGTPKIMQKNYAEKLKHQINQGKIK